MRASPNRSCAPRSCCKRRARSRRALAATFPPMPRASGPSTKPRSAAGESGRERVSTSVQPQPRARTRPPRWACEDILRGFYAAKIRDPVNAPRLAGIGRKRLFEMESRRRNAGKGESNADRLTGEPLVIVECAAAVRERANRRDADAHGTAIGEVDVPLAGSGIVKSQAEAFDMIGAVMEFELPKVGTTAPNLPIDVRAD